jgi:hypothetical protein
MIAPNYLFTVKKLLHVVHNLPPALKNEAISLYISVICNAHVTVQKRFKHHKIKLSLLKQLFICLAWGLLSYKLETQKVARGL